ncbi:DUF3014 domain-containing protein [Thioalkalivibrio sp. XN279]|uniref:DUF3014 domain-containing protein n=1 Tax=Thioalkalivibrio sp. XN279 TaxID=2714953 RepID=UPI001980073D|nr:DUF3014 domain-containing protein [Thioalkalivibrio sp. XN279]
MHKHLAWGLLALAVIGLVAFCYPRQVHEPAPQPVQLPDAPDAGAEQAPAAAPVAREPEPEPAFVAEPEAEPAAPLPSLDESDAEARAVIAAAAGETLASQHLAANDVIRKLVATTDNLSRDGLWIQARVVPPIGGLFLVEGEEDELYIAPANYERYAPLFRLVEAVDIGMLADAYRRHYPLLQQAYEELGYPGRQFHNRALEIIDHLLATPRVSGPLALARPHVLYQFADPELEALSPGQKILLRIGPENAAIARTKLIQLRTALEQLPGAPDAD